MSSKVPVLIGLAGVVVAVALFLLLSDDTADEAAEVDTTPSTEEPRTERGEGGQKPKEKPAEANVPTIEVEGGQPVGGVREIEVASGEEIRFVVESDVAEEVHLHGYDVSQNVSAGGRVEFRVPAT